MPLSPELSVSYHSLSQTAVSQSPVRDGAARTMHDYLQIYATLRPSLLTPLRRSTSTSTRHALHKLAPEPLPLLDRILRILRHGAPQRSDANSVCCGVARAQAVFQRC